MSLFSEVCTDSGRQVHATRTCQGVRVGLPVVTASGLQVVAQSIKCHLRRAGSPQLGPRSLFGGNSALKVGRKEMGFLNLANANDVQSWKPVS